MVERGEGRLGQVAEEGNDGRRWRGGKCKAKVEEKLEDKDGGLTHDYTKIRMIVTEMSA